MLNIGGALRRLTVLKPFVVPLSVIWLSELPALLASVGHQQLGGNLNALPLVGNEQDLPVPVFYVDIVADVRSNTYKYDRILSKKVSDML